MLMKTASTQRTEASRPLRAEHPQAGPARLCLLHDDFSIRPKPDTVNIS